VLLICEKRVQLSGATDLREEGSPAEVDAVVVARGDEKGHSTDNDLFTDFNHVFFRRDALWYRACFCAAVLLSC